MNKKNNKNNKATGLSSNWKSHALIKKLQDWDNKLESMLLLTCYTFIVVSIIVEVIRRFVLSFSSVWGEEMARYLFIYLVWFGAAYAMKRRLHIRIDLLQNFLSPKKKIINNIFSEVVTIIFCTIMFILSVETFFVATKFGVVTDGLRISKAYFMFSTVIGFLLIILRSIQQIVCDVLAYRSGKTNDKSTLFSS